ncbi:hypothetical protein DD237_004027 [Peronospora effusa]|uniref:BED-type domain-containing protein n=1 Tax=Peronospora effusa TaxID=542832 RepID=A0A425CF22_9STRA|nr:hypothetical protein DD237_004027 [Peronospora effusa]
MADETEVETVARIQAVDIRDLYPNLAREDVTSRLCLLCAAKLKDKTHNLTRHLERHHAGALLQLLEQRNQVPRSVLASRTRRSQQEKAAATRQSVGQVEDTLFRTGDAKLVLARWLAQEQLPMNLIDNSGFREFIEVLNKQFRLPKSEELQQILGTLVTGTTDSKLTSLHDTDTMAGSGDDVILMVEMLALRATCRCSEDSPLISCSRVACDIAGKGEAKVRVLRATASLLDAQSCRGKILGRSGVLGRSFVGVVSEMQSLASNQTEVTAGDSVKVSDKVVASPYVTRMPVIPFEKQEQEQLENSTHHGRQDCTSSCIVGVSASCGTLAEYIVLPVANLSIVPPTIPDDLALLADDMSVVLSIVSELQRRHVTNIAILSDGPATILSNLLTRLLHQDVQYPAQNLHVFSTSPTSSSSVWLQHASLTPLEIFQPAAIAHVLAQQTELALDAVVDLVGSEASAEFATSLVQSMGCVVFVDRSRLELQPPSTIAMDMNTVVVRELQVVSVHDCHDYLDDALQYLATQAQSQQSAMELRKCLVASVELSQALHQLQTIPERTFEARYLQVKPDVIST